MSESWRCFSQQLFLCFSVFSAKKRWRRNCRNYERIFRGRRNLCQCDELFIFTHLWRLLQLARHLLVTARRCLNREMVTLAHLCRQSRKLFSLNNTGPTRKASVSTCVIGIIIATCITSMLMQRKQPLSRGHARVRLPTLPMNRHKLSELEQLLVFIILKPNLER